MKAARCFFLTAAIALSLSLFVPPAHASRDTPSNSDDPTQISDQIVRLSLVQGDVRIARGKAAQHATGGDWGQAAVNLPLASGFSLATGTGRAEIELEDDSTIDLGDNSVLTFDQLADEGETPHTVLTLVSGFATLHVHPSEPGETFLLNTPAARVLLRYGSHTFMRVDSYLDATRITPQDDSGLHVQGKPDSLELRGKTITYYADRRSPSETAAVDAGFAAWDAWTAKRVAARTAALSAVMKEAGLTEPLPGLADLAGRGTFFACAPYGTCWQPNVHNQSGSADSAVQPTRFRVQPLWPHAHLVLAAQMYASQYPDPGLYDPLFDDASFPCDPGGIGRLYGYRPGAYGAGYGIDPSYAWAECHEGSWIARNNRYVWVVGTTRHHHCPVSWVKYQGRTAFVPIHPGDVRGKPPLNLNHGLFQIPDRKGEPARFVAFQQSAPVKALSSPPREFRAAYYPPLQRAEAPRLMAHALQTIQPHTMHGESPNPRLTSAPIVFSHRSQSFALARTVDAGGHSSTVTEHFGGNIASGRSGGGSGSSFSGGRSGGASGGARASSSGSSFSGAASHGGTSSSGASAGGAGGSHR